MGCRGEGRRGLQKKTSKKLFGYIPQVGERGIERDAYAALIASPSPAFRARGAGWAGGLCVGLSAAGSRLFFLAYMGRLLPDASFDFTVFEGGLEILEAGIHGMA